MQRIAEWLVLVINWLLIHGGQAAFALWENLKVLLGGLWGPLDAVVNPVLSPILSFLNPICVVIGDGVYAVVGRLPIWASLLLISAVAGVIMLVFFRYTSNQEGIARAKDDIKAHLLALKLYKDDLRVVFTAQGRILLAVARLQRYVIVPVLLATPFMLLAMAQMGIRHQWQALPSDEQTLITMTMLPGAANPIPAELRPNPGVLVEVGPVPGGGKIVWRVRGAAPGRHTLQFDVGQIVVEKELVVGEGFQRVSAVRPGRHWISQLLHPVEPAFPVDSPVQSIEILYPPLESSIYGTDYWLLSFFVVSMIVALVLSPVFKVKF